MAQEELDWYSRHAKKSAQQIADAESLVLIVTDGPAPIHDYRPELPSLSVIPPRVDTTGAGDSFCGALLWKMGQSGDIHGSLASFAGDSFVHETLGFAAACAARTCQGRGAMAAMPGADFLGQI